MATKGSYGLDKRGNRVSANSPSAVSIVGGGAPEPSVAAPVAAPAIGGGMPDLGKAGTGGLQPGQKAPAAGPQFDPGPRRADETVEQYKARILETPLFYKDPNSATGFSSTPVNARQGRPVPTLSPQQAAEVLAKYGIGGTGTKLEGLTAKDAAARAAEAKQRLLGGALQTGGSFYEVTQLGNVKKASDALRTSLSKVNVDPWQTKDDKLAARKSALDMAAGQIAQSFADPQSFISSYNGNPAFQTALADYVKAGGTVSDVAAKIAAKGTAAPGAQTTAEYLAGLNGPQGGLTVVKDLPNADGTRTVTYSNGETAVVNQSLNGDGTVSYAETATGDLFRDAAAAFTGRERAQTIEGIDRIAQVPQQYRDFYYGSDKELGVLQRQRQEADLTIKRLTDAYESSGKSTDEQFDYQIQKNGEEAKAKVAELEEKRIEAKAYLTGRLAQLGALTTTGEAPAALANLDAKYEKAKAETMSALQSTNKDLLMKKREVIGKLQSDLADKIEDIRGDLSKSEEDVRKEIMKVTIDTEGKVASEVKGYNAKAEAAYKSFLNVNNKATREYLNQFLKTASGGLSSEYMKQLTGAVNAANPPKKTSPSSGGFKSGSLVLTGADLASGEQALEASRGEDGHANSAVYTAMYKKWVAGGGLLKDFILKYPPKNYGNPADSTLPSFLRPAASKATSGGRSLNG